MSEQETKPVETTTPEVTPEAKAEETTTVKPDSEKTVDEIKAEAEALENQVKELKTSNTEKDEEIKQNMIRRKEKAQEKLEKAKLEAQPQAEIVETRDLITLSKHDISEDSDKAKILAKYKKGGLISNYTEGLEHAGVKAEFEALDAKNTAKTIIDENSDEETRLKTTKEVVKQYQATGEIPTDPKMQVALARENLKSMGF